MALAGAVGVILVGACVLAALRSKRVNGTQKVKNLKLR
jgi:hypothetical protein